MLTGFNSCQNLSDNKVYSKENVDKITPSKFGSFKFDNDSYDFGKIKDGDTVTHVFKFANVGEAPIVIQDISTSCGCTAAAYTKSAVSPNDTGTVTISFSKRHDPGRHTKSAIIKANTKDPYTILHIVATVEQ